MKPWRAILAACVIFLAGLASGVMASHLFWGRKPSAGSDAGLGGPSMPWMGQRVEFMRRLSERLHLSPEQREQIDRQISESQQRLRALWEPVEPQAREELKALRKRIEETLPPDQRAEFQRIMAERHSRGAGPGKKNGAGAPEASGGTNPAGPAGPSVGR